MAEHCKLAMTRMPRAWCHPETVSGRRGGPRPRLYAVAWRVAIDQHRARQETIAGGRAR